MSKRYRDGKGEPVLLGPELGRGGEGAVFQIQGRADSCAKLYAPGKADATMQKKLAAMTLAPPADPTLASFGHRSITWPQALLYGPGGEFVGYTMPRIDRRVFKTALNYFHPDAKSHRPNWKYLYAAAMNVASAVAAIHERGHRVGDINESNLLVAANSLVTVIDCDSFQITPDGGGPSFRCLVGKEEYTAPELIGKSYASVDRTAATDAFALGVLLFQFLMEGWHPYSAKGPLVEKADNLVAKIRLGHFAYPGNIRGAQPPPGAPPFENLPLALRGLFERAFGAGHRDPAERPSPKEWYQVLRRHWSDLRECGANENHWYYTHLAACPWCALTQATGRDPYPSPYGQQIALADPSRPADPEAAILEYVRMAMADGKLNDDEKAYILAKGKRLGLKESRVKELIFGTVKGAWPSKPAPRSPAASATRYHSPGLQPPPGPPASGKVSRPPAPAAIAPPPALLWGLAAGSTVALGVVLAGYDPKSTLGWLVAAQAFVVASLWTFAPRPRFKPLVFGALSGWLVVLGLFLARGSGKRPVRSPGAPAPELAYSAAEFDALVPGGDAFPFRVALGFPASTEAVFTAVQETLREMGFEMFERLDLEPERSFILTGVRRKEMAMREETKHQVAVAVVSRRSAADVYAKVLCYRGRRGKWQPMARPAKCLEDLFSRIEKRLGSSPASRLP